MGPKGPQAPKGRSFGRIPQRRLGPVTELTRGGAAPKPRASAAIGAGVSAQPNFIMPRGWAHERVALAPRLRKGLETEPGQTYPKNSEASTIHTVVATINIREASSGGIMGHGPATAPRATVRLKPLTKFKGGAPKPRAPAATRLAQPTFITPKR